MDVHKRWLGLIPQQSVDAGENIATHNDGVPVELPTGVQVRVSGGAIRGTAPPLTGIDQEI